MDPLRTRLPGDFDPRHRVRAPAESLASHGEFVTEARAAPKQPAPTNGSKMLGGHSRFGRIRHLGHVARRPRARPRPQARSRGRTGCPPGRSCRRYGPRTCPPQTRQKRQQARPRERAARPPLWRCGLPGDHQRRPPRILLVPGSEVPAPSTGDYGPMTKLAPMSPVVVQKKLGSMSVVVCVRLSWPTPAKLIQVSDGWICPAKSKPAA